VVYVASYVWLLIDPKGLMDLFNRELSIAGQHADPTLPVQTGTTLLVGALLVVALFSGARWRRSPKAVPATEPAPAGTGPDVEELFGLGPGDPSMFRAAGSDTEAPSAHTGEEPTESGIPAQAAPAEPGTPLAGRLDGRDGEPDPTDQPGADGHRAGGLRGAHAARFARGPPRYATRTTSRTSGHSARIPAAEWPDRADHAIRSVAPGRYLPGDVTALRHAACRNGGRPAFDRHAACRHAASRMAAGRRSTT